MLNGPGIVETMKSNVLPGLGAGARRRSIVWNVSLLVIERVAHEQADCDKTFRSFPESSNAPILFDPCGGSRKFHAVGGGLRTRAIMQDMPGSVTAVDVKTMKAVGHYPLGDKGRCCSG